MDVEVAATWRSLLKFSSIGEIGRARGRGMDTWSTDRDIARGGEKGTRSRARGRAGELYFSRVVIKVYYANEIMSAPLFYRGWNNNMRRDLRAHIFAPVNISPLKTQTNHLSKCRVNNRIIHPTSTYLIYRINK